MSEHDGLPRPYFFQDPGIDALFRIAVHLAQELAVTREILHRHGLDENFPEASDPDVNDRAREIIDRIFGFVADMGGTDSAGGWEPYRQLVESRQQES